MVIPKKRQLNWGVVVPVFVAAMITVPLTNGVMAGAVSVPSLLHLIDSKDNRQYRQNDKETTKKITEVRSDKTTKSQVADVSENTVASKNQTTQPPVSEKSSSTTDQSQPYQAATTVTLAEHSAVVPSAPADTSTASAQLSNAQADKTVKPTVYQTAKIDMNERNDLLQSSLIVAGGAAMLYILTYASVLWRLIYGEPAPNRRTITQ